MRYFDVFVIYLTFYSLDLVINLNTFISSIIDVFLKRFEISFQMADSVVLFTDSIFILSLALCNFRLSSAKTSMQISDYFL